ncbi:MAG: AI-2E family transporter [Parvibaculaceae bacterium]
MPRSGNGTIENGDRLYLAKAVSIAIIGTFIILMIGTLYFARGFFLPVVLALLIALTFNPLVRYLSRRGVPAFASAIVLVVGLFAALGSASLYLADPVSRVIADVPAIADRIEQRFDHLRGPLSKIMNLTEQVEEMARSDEAPVEKVVIAQPGIASWAADTISGLITTLGATLVLLVFLLASGDLFLHKLVRAVPTLTDKKRSLRIVHDVEGEVSHYLRTITLINIGFGFCVAAAMAALGMPNAILWGVAAAALNFIPYVGAMAGTAATFVAGLITFPTIGLALLPPAAYLIFHLIESAFVTPLVLGRRLELNAVAIFISLAFWGWMWGIVGALIAVPLLVVIKVFCDHFDGLSKLGEFLSGEPAPEIEEATEQQPAE